MKMSDMFALPVRRHFSVVVDRNEHQCSYSEQINFAVHAINNHDRLEQENAELREFVNRIINDISGYDQEEAKYYWRNELEKILNK